MMPSFEGIPFRNWRDYDYATARRALVSAMGQLCRHPLLKKEYGITPRCWVRRRIKDEDWYEPIAKCSFPPLAGGDLLSVATVSDDFGCFGPA